MSSSFGSSSSQEVDLNITPIIDCFTVLITFLLASSSFISIQYLEATQGQSATETNEEGLVLEMSILENHQVIIKDGQRNRLKEQYSLSDPQLSQRILELIKSTSIKSKISGSSIRLSPRLPFKEVYLLMAPLQSQNIPITLVTYTEE